MSGSDSRPPPPRLVADAPLPSYSYVTGRFPHPTRDPTGHSFGHAMPRPPAISDERWSDSREYLVGCDLFNYGYYWEAHETWEALWQACGRAGIAADFLKGLIKLAAAGVKSREGRPAGIARHAARGGQLFEHVRDQIAGPCYLGLDVGWLITIAHELPAHVHEPLHAGPVEIVFDFVLLPTATGSASASGAR